MVQNKDREIVVPVTRKVAAEIVREVDHLPLNTTLHGPTPTGGAELVETIPAPKTGPETDNS